MKPFPNPVQRTVDCESLQLTAHCKPLQLTPYRKALQPTLRAAMLAAAFWALPTATVAEPRFASPVTPAAPAPAEMQAAGRPATEAPPSEASHPTAVTSPPAPPPPPSVAAVVPPVAPPPLEITPATPAVIAAPTPAEMPPTGGSEFGWAALRLVLACTAVGILLMGGLTLYRRALQPGPRTTRRRGAGWLARWVPASASEDDRITLLTRSYLGTRESVCVLRVGTERFLVGVTAAQISMLGRLGEASSPGRAPTAPATPDFSEALMAAATARDGGDADLRTALARSRARLAQLVAGRSPGA